MSFRGVRAICFITALILTLIFSYVCFKTALDVKGTLNYVSDETWYVNSARNILREVFNIQPVYIDDDGYIHYTIFFKSFNDRDYSRGEVSKALQEVNGTITYEYSKIPALAVKTLRPLELEDMLIQRGYMYSDHEVIENYLNTEHPPLVKYIIGLSMLLLGDKPLSWRIPNIILGSLTILIVYMVAARLTSPFIGLTVFIFAFLDPIFRSLSSIAMLEIYVTFFTALSMISALKERYLISALSIGLAAASKLIGAFSIPALLVYMVLKREHPSKAILISIYIPLIVWISINIPLIAYMGIQQWILSIEGGVKWHLTPRPDGPPTSTPWGWFINENPFPLHYSPDLSASVNPAIYIIALISLIFTPYLSAKLRSYLIPPLWFTTSFTGYLLAYFMGNRTMYSFYALIFTPSIYLLASILIYIILIPEKMLEALKLYIKPFR
jgi:predicted membrane-bound dolichyl-phosphate-mannose-protein mannosyltransferase